MLPPICSVTASLIFLVVTCSGWSEAVVVDESRMLAAVQRLSQEFSDLKTYGLAVDSLQTEYSNADISYSLLSNVTDLLLSIQSNSRVSDIVNIFETIISNDEDNQQQQSITSCCSAATITSQPCCYGCNDDIIDDELQTAAYTIIDADINEEVELRVGLTNGNILVFPSVTESCVNEDARLMSWYNGVTESKHREVVVFLDINQQGVTGNSSRSQLREVAISVIQSLSDNDLVGLVLVTDNNQRSCPDNILKLATPEIKNDLVRIIEQTIATENRVYTVAYREAIEYFTNSVTTDKLLLLITDGRVSISNTDLEKLQNSTVNTSLTDRNFEFSIYTANEVQASNNFLNYLSGFTDGRGIDSLSDIADYASVFSTLTPDQYYMYITSDFNRRNEISLSISRVWLNGSDVVGVVNALLPWRYLMSEIAEVTLPRPSSYYFILNQQGDLLYHDLFKSINVHGLLPSVFEEETEFTNNILTTIMSGNGVNMSPVNKTIVVNHSDDEYSNIIVPSTYSCQSVITINNTVVANEGLIYTCVVLATKDRSILESFNVQDISNIYRGDPSRLPIYSQSLSSQSESDTCNAFCIQSVSERFSVQFNALNSSAVNDIISYIDGSGTRPVGIEENIAEELSIISIAGSQWITHSTKPASLPIKRRHLATPSGIYLGYPAVQLNTSFIPQYLSWYIAAVTNRGMVSLSASHTDELDGVGVVYTASFPIINDYDVIMSILGADITLNSLLININEAFNDSQFCQQDGYNCVILNDQGYFVINPNTPENHILDVEEYNSIVKSLLDDNILSKIGCNDVTNVEIGHRIYYTLSMNDSIKCYTPTGGCLDFCISNIPDTNSFLLVTKQKAVCKSNGFRFCAQPCFDCTEIKLLSVECPCHCDESICGDTPILDLPICPAQTTPPSNYSPLQSGRVSTTTCDDRSLCCQHNESNCMSSPSCDWCSSETTCIKLGTCCSGDTDCCLSNNALPNCFREYCLQEQDVCPTDDPDTVESISVDRQAAIIGGVVGGVFGIALLGLLIGCCVWYQFIKEPDSVQANGKSDFNFTDMKVAGVNKTAIELKGVNKLAEEDGGEKHTMTGPAAQSDGHDVIV